MESKSRCAFFLCTCDSYEDLWDPFFQLMNIFWKDIPYNVYINTENKKYENNGLNFHVDTFNLLENRNPKISWSQRLIDCLKRVDEEYVFLTLDDYFICDDVPTHKIEEILDIMDNNKNIASFQLKGTYLKNEIPEYEKRDNTLVYHEIEKDEWKTLFIPTVWRKSTLLKWLHPWETIWAFEGYGSKRVQIWRKKYGEEVKIAESPVIYDFLWIDNCSAVINGKWYKSDRIFNFFKNNNIKIDYSKRGFLSYDQFHSITWRDILKRYTTKQIIIKCYNRIRSFF